MVITVTLVFTHLMSIDLSQRITFFILHKNSSYKKKKENQIN